MYLWFTDFLWLIDPLVMLSETAFGLAPLFGVCVRLVCIEGALQMLFFWIGAREGGLLAGLPVEHGYFVENSFAYALVLFGFGVWGAGRILEIDARLERTEFVEQHRRLKYSLG